MSDVKEVVMDAPQGGGRGRGRRPRSRRKKQVADATCDDTVVTKVSVLSPSPAPSPSPSPAPAPAPASAPAHLLVPAKKGIVQKIILSPPKKKAPKVLLVPKFAVKPVKKSIVRKTFKRKKIRVEIDNSEKTRRRRQSVIEGVDNLSDDQIRGAAVAARLSRRERVANAPIGLLRQMVKDYQTMKGMLL